MNFNYNNNSNLSNDLNNYDNDNKKENTNNENNENNENINENKEIIKEQTLLEKLKINEEKKNKIIQKLMKIIKIKIGDLIEKENLISLLKDKKFNKNITKLKTIMNLSRSNSSFLFKHSNTYTDDDLINYLMRCINDPNSSMNKDKKIII
jgi:hypothetical protein